MQFRLRRQTQLEINDGRIHRNTFGDDLVKPILRVAPHIRLYQCSGMRLVVEEMENVLRTVWVAICVMLSDPLLVLTQEFAMD